MAFERQIPAVSPILFTANGTNLGVVTISDTTGFYIKQLVALQSSTISGQISFQVKNVLSDTQLIVGPADNKIGISPNFFDISGYTVADGAFIYAPQQSKPPVPDKDHYLDVYEIAPVSADRVIFVDPHGNFYNDGNPLPIAFDGTIAVGEVEVRGTNGNFIEPNADGSINAVITGDTFQIEVGVPDRSAFTYGTSVEQPVGGVFQDTSPALISGQTGAVRVTQNRAFHSNLRNSSGAELDYDFGISSAATLRTSALIGNATGAADFNAGSTGAQTLRVSANITRNGTELSYNSGASDANTLRAAVNLKREGNDLDYNFGSASANTLRSSALIGNATGAADFNSGASGAQTLRVASNLYDFLGNGITSTLLSGKRGLDVNIANDTFQIDVGTPDQSVFTYGSSIEQPVGGVFQDTSPGLSAGQTGAVRLTQNRAFHSNLRNASGTELDYNFGISSVATLRTSALVGNSTGAADFNAGAAGAQTLRVSSNITRNGTELSYNSGASDANTLRTSSNLKREGNDLDYNFGISSANTLRTSALVGNSTGAADFNAGSTGAQTLRVTANITRNGTELSYNDGVSDANTLRTSSNLKRQGNDLDYNFGAASANTLRTSALIGNATGAADFNAGTTGAQTLRITSNITRNGTELSYNNGASDANTIRTAPNISDGAGNKLTSQVSGAQRALDVGINVAGVQVDPRKFAQNKTATPASNVDGTLTNPTADPKGNLITVSEASALSRWGQMFIVTTGVITVGSTAETPFFLFRNPNASGKSVRISKLILTPPNGAGNTTYNFYVNPTITGNGTALTIVGARQTGQATVVSLANKLPTVSANGTLFNSLNLNQGAVYNLDVDFSLWLEANNSILVTSQQSQNGAGISNLTMIFSEE